MDVVCGLDVGIDKVAATFLGDSFKESRMFGVSIEEISRLQYLLRGRGCCRVVMESTGVYWRRAASRSRLLIAVRLRLYLGGRRTSLTVNGWLTC